MKKATLKTYLITLLVLMLAFAMMLTAFACTNPEETPEDDSEETTTSFESLVTNGNFTAYSESDSQPFSPDSWTAYTPDGYSSENKVAGVIDTGADYAKNSSAWDNAANPFGDVKDEKVLMIYNKEANAYGYTNTFSASAGCYYKVSVLVKAVIEGGGGATFRLSSDNGFAAFNAIASSDAFETYTIYMVAPVVGNTTVKVTLSLGYDDNKVKGYVFFDDVKAEKITEADYNAVTIDDTVVKVKKVSMLYPDGEFNNFTYSSTTPYTSLSWTVADGNTSGEDHALDKVGGKSLSTSNLKSGVLSVASAEDWNDTDYGTYPGLPVAESEDKNVLYLGINKSTDDKYTPSAFYYYSNKKIRIELASLYEISVWVKATVDVDSNNQKGARVVLKGTDEYSSVVINTTGSQATNNGWVKVIFYVFGNQVRNKDFEIQLWLGDDKDSSTLTQGKAFFDKLTVSKVKTFTDEERATELSAKRNVADLNDYIKVVDLVSVEDDLITNSNFANLDGYDFSAPEGVKVNEEKKDVIVKIMDKATLDATEWTEEYKTTYGIDENPKYPYAFSRVLIVNNTIPCAYTMKTSDLIEINQSQCYRLSVWMKTIGLGDDDSVTLKLEDEEGTEISSFSVNTAKYENVGTNNYAEYSFYLKGALPVLSDSTTNTQKVRIVISNGSGTAYDPSSFKKGAFLVANINMEKIKYTEYNSASTGDYDKKKDYAENEGTVTNGNFNSYNVKNTEIDPDTGFVAMSDKDGNTHLTADVSDWTNNVDSRYGTTKLVNGDKTINHKYYLDKNDVNAITLAELVGRDITTIKVKGPNDYDKTFESESEWNKIFSIDAITNKLTWANSSTNNSYTITKSDSDNGNNYFAPELAGKSISKISITGPNDFSKTLESATEWEKYFTINYATSRVYWAETQQVTDLASGSYSLSVTMLSWSTANTKSSLTLSKTAEENEKNNISLDEIKDNAIVKISISGTSFSATYRSAAEWNKYFLIDTATGKISWANTEDVGKLATGDYTLTVVTDLYEGNYELDVTFDELLTNDLIAGIINVNASQAYLDQFGLTANTIYDHWSTTTASLSDETKAKVVSFGAPNLLIITARDGRSIQLKNTYVNDEAKNDMTSTPALKSPTVSLSANSYYLLKCYAKAIEDADPDTTTIGEIYVSTTSTDTPISAHIVRSADGWVEYNFIVETGLSSVSAAFELYFGEKGNADTKYGGTLLFDSFSYKSLTEEEYKALGEKEDTKDSKFTTITFDNSSAKDTAVSPSGFSATNSSSANSDTQVSGIIAKDHYVYTTSAGKNNLGIYETVTTTDDEGKETSEDKLMEGSSLTQGDIFTDAGMEDGATVGDYVLMINNRKATYQSYYISGLSLESESYYRFSAYVRTAKIDKNDAAKVYVKISDEPISFEVNTEYDEEGEAIENKWKKLTFYFHNEKSSSESASIYFQLGENTDENSKMKGYLFIDNVSLSKITANEYENETANNEIYEKDENNDDKLDANGNKILSDASKTYRLANIVTVLQEDESTDENDSDNESDNEEEEKTSLNTTLLWTYITSIVIAVILIAVIVVLLIKKYRRPKKDVPADENATSYSRNAKKEEGTDSKKSASARDEYKD